MCTCHSAEHQARFSWFGEPDKFMSMEIHLADQPFWKRLRLGLAYILGRKSRFGEFDEICLGKRHAKAFREIAEKLESMDGEA